MLEETNLTLKEGLDRFYEEYDNLESQNMDDIPNEIKSIFRSHDVAHVLFGCDITLFGEGSVKYGPSSEQH